MGQISKWRRQNNLQTNRLKKETQRPTVEQTQLPGAQRVIHADNIEIFEGAVLPPDVIGDQQITPGGVAGSNLLQDGSFEDEHPDVEYGQANALWTDESGGVAERHTGDALHSYGGACFMLEEDVINPRTIQQGGGPDNIWDIPVEPNHVYSLSAYVMYMGDDGQAWFSVEWRDASHTVISVDHGTTQTNLVNEMWTRATQAAMLAPETAEFCRFRLHVRSVTAAAPPMIRVDACQMEEGAIPTAFSPIMARGKSILTTKGSFQFDDSIAADNRIDFMEQESEGFQVGTTRQGVAAGGVSSTASATWSFATNAGSMLMMTLSLTDPDAVPPTPTLPAGGWVLTSTTTLGASKLLIYTLPNASSRSGSQAITLGDSVNWLLQMVEITGVSAVDVNATNTGTSTTPDSGTTAVTTQADEFWVGILFRKDSTSALSSLTNGFNFYIANLFDSGGIQINTSIVTKAVTATGAANVSGTISPLASWLGSMVTFKCKPNEAAAPTTDMVRLQALDVRGDSELISINDQNNLVVLSEPAGVGFGNIARHTWVGTDCHNNFTSNIGAGTGVQIGQFEYLTGGGVGSLIGDNADATVPGAHILRMGTTAGNTSRAHIRGTRDWPGANAGRVRMGFRVKIPTGHLSNATDRYDIGFGIYDANDFRAVTNGIFVRYSDSKATPAGTASTWDLVHCASSVRSADNLNDNGGEITVAADTWYTIELEILPGIGTSVWINGVKKVTSYNTNSPAAFAGSGFRAGILRVAGSSNVRDIYLDYMWYTHRLATTR